MAAINWKLIGIFRVILFSLLVFFMMLLVCHAAASAPSLAEHSDALQILIGACFIGFTFMCLRTLKQIDSNQRELFGRIKTLERDFYILKGAHDSITEKGGHD